MKKKEVTKTIIPGLIHLVKVGNKIKYLLKIDGQLRISETYTDENYEYTPKQQIPIEVLSYEKMKEMGDLKEIDTKELLNEIIQFIRENLELPNDDDYLLLASWIIHTYFIEKFNETPILYFNGIKETGKTRAGEILGRLALRGLRITSPTEATIFRPSEIFKPSLIIDEISLFGKGARPGLFDILKTTYKRGLKVPRINNEKEGEDKLEYYDIFCPLVICTTENLPDIIKSRCITFQMQKNFSRDVEKPIDKEKVEELKYKLALLRSHVLDQKLEDPEPIARGRLNEILQPLYQTLILVDPDRKAQFIEIVKRLQSEKLDEENDSLEAEIIQILKAEKNKGYVLTKGITNKVNLSNIFNYPISDRLISFCMQRLGFKKGRFEKGKRGFIIDLKLLERLKAQYGIENEDNDTNDT